MIVTFLVFFVFALAAEVDAAVTLTASPTGAASYPCGRRGEEPCSFETALEMALPHTSIVLTPGVYEGEWHIPKPVSLVAKTRGTVIFDGRGEFRPLWFDNVPARVEGITFQNGVGEGGGCVLVTLSSAHRQTNNFTHCDFYNCTATPVADDNEFFQRTGVATNNVGGGLAILYSASDAAAHEITESNFTKNFARGDVAAAGGVVVSHDSTINLNHCRTYTLHTTQAHEMEAYNGIWRVRRGGQRVGGMPVYEGPPQSVGAPPLLLVACRDQRSLRGQLRWSIVATTEPENREDELHKLACNSQITSDSVVRPPEDTLQPDEVTKWKVRSGFLGESINFQCEDAAQQCDEFQTINLQKSQLQRSGLFRRVPKMKFHGRSVFRRVERPEVADEPQYMYYCHWNKEWILTDVAPEAQEKINSGGCSRGVASFPTHSIHPMFQRNWRYWDVSTWKTSSGLRGFAVQCLPRPELLCPITELVHRHPYKLAEPLVLPNGPYLLTNLSFNGRPTYATPNNRSFMWYCGRFGEWVMTEDTPFSHGDKGELCMRTLSSHRTTAITPYHHGRDGYSHYVNDEWSVSAKATSVECSADCPILSIVNVPNRYMGVYETIGAYNGRRLFQQHGSNNNVLFYSFECGRHAPEHAVGCWVLADTTDVDWNSPANVYAMAVTGSADPMGTELWHDATGGSAKTPTIACERHRRCSALNVFFSQPHLKQALGTYVEQSTTVFDSMYPLYKQKTTADGVEPSYVYYCTHSKSWAIGTPPKKEGDPCAALIVSQPTASTNPVQNVLWNKYFHEEKWQEELMGVTCAADHDLDAPTTMRLMPLRSYGAINVAKGVSMHVNDVIKGCNFVGNVALGDVGRRAAGGLMIHHGFTTATHEHVNVYRKLQLQGNEMVGVNKKSSGAGGISIHSENHMNRHINYFVDVNLDENKGMAGGVQFSGTYAVGLRLQMRKNKATASGGGLRLSHRSNVTLYMSTCTKNEAVVSGGCAKVDVASYNLYQRSRLGECQAPMGSLFDGGSIDVTDSKLYSVSEWAITSCFLHMVSTEMLCAGGKPSSVVGGFGCVPDALNPNTPRPQGTVQPGPTPAAGRRTNEAMASYIDMQTLFRFILYGGVVVFTYLLW